MPTKMFRLLVYLFGAAATLVAASSAMACGAGTDCVIGDRTYRIVLPDGYDGKGGIGAVIFIHGYRGTAAAEMKNAALTSLASELGIAYAAAQADGPEWNIPHVPGGPAPGVDELAYFDALANDLVARFAVDRSRIVVAGFSSGAMMTWHLACYRGNGFAGFVANSGTFWAPVPETCPTGPVNLIHYHGRQDPVVPLAGRQIKDTRQGNVFEAIDMMRRLGDYRAVAEDNPPGLDCSRWDDAERHRLELCLFDGGHTVKRANLERALRILLKR